MTQQEIIAKAFKTEFGAFTAPTVVTGTGAVACNGLAFQVFETGTIIASITINGTAITSFNATELPSGFTVFGIITSVTLSAGNGLVYSGNVEGVN